MKSILTLFCAVLTMGTLFAQIPYAGGIADEPSKFKTHEVSEAALDHLQEIRERSSANLDNTRGGGTQYWVSYDNALETVGGLAPVRGIGLMWEDSSARIANAPDPDFYWFLHQFNQNFDPNSDVINDAFVENSTDVTFGSGKQYEVDSMRMFYQYERVSGASVVDTLLIWVYGDGNIGGFTFSDWPSAGIMTDVSVANYSFANRRPAGSILETFEIPLTTADTISGGFFGVITLPLEVTITKNAMIGAAWYFKSGQTYSFGDVLFDNSTLAPGTLNNFLIGYFEEEDGAYPPSTVLDEGALNMGGNVTNDIFYNISALGWNGQYIPGMAFTPPWPYEHVLVDWLVTPFGAHYISGTTGTPCEVQFSDLSNITPVTSWLWEFGDGAIAVDQNPSHTFAANGSYMVRLEVRDDAAQVFGYEKLVTVANCATGLNDLKNLTSFTVYPNPASEFVTVSFESAISQDLEMTVFNVQGQAVHSEMLTNVSAYNNQIDVSSLAAGAYYVKLQNGSQVAVQQFMID